MNKSLCLVLRHTPQNPTYVPLKRKPSKTVLLQRSQQEKIIKRSVYNNYGGKNMNKKALHAGEWFLCQSKNNKVLAHDVDFMKIFEESKKYKVGDVFIQQHLQQGTCFF